MARKIRKTVKYTIVKGIDCSNPDKIEEFSDVLIGAYTRDVANGYIRRHNPMITVTYCEIHEDVFTMDMETFLNNATREPRHAENNQ